MTPTLANGQPAAASYYRDGDGTYHALGLAILTVTPAGITRITVFGDPFVFGHQHPHHHSRPRG
jgi:RNA polymerase sigma-70 factor (ECF subfamily)